MEKIAIFPGSFDPITIGHESIVRRARPFFDKIYVSIGANSTKKNLFPLEHRQKWIESVFDDDPGILVSNFEGLTVHHCKKLNASYIIRGLRTASDFEYERAIAQNNRCLDSSIETVFLLTAPEHTHINSTIVREIYINGGDIHKFVPKKIRGTIHS